MTTTSKLENQRRPDQVARRLLAKHLDNLSSETPGALCQACRLEVFQRAGVRKVVKP
jgi:hypothetical protein